MNKILFGLFVLVAFVIFSGCLKSKAPGCSFTEINRKAPDSQVTQVRDYLDGKGLITDDLKLDSSSGVYYIVESPGTTVSPDVCSVITFRYKGTFTNDQVFDQSMSTPVVYTLGELIVGWQKGLKFIKGGGGKIRLFIPWSLGYGESEVRNQNTGEVLIPAKSILIFELILDAVQ
ncbi:MAG: FKBP-type peptidyl-prolyl cis-trans isomerase [Chitinophagaceae bacterium]|nr:FKBP-type peptidyl-prolyl cis-trans isomerase [Chitinophagaceae bacterium]